MRSVCFIIALLLADVSFAQTVTNVDAYQDGNNIVIAYSLHGAGHLQKNAQITVLPTCSMDGGKTFFGLKSVSGDLRTFPGPDKKIIWNVLNDVEEFVGENIVFKVEITGYEGTAESSEGADLYRRGQECERNGKYAEAIKYYRLASRKGYKQADERIMALQLHFW